MNPAYALLDGAAWIRLDDGKANAMRTEGLRTLAALLDRAEKEGARAVVIRGRDGLFSGGLDRKWLPTLGPEGLAELAATFASTMQRVRTSPLPTVALVSGHAVAGGCILACACDRRLGPRGAYRLHMNEVAIGIPVPARAARIVASAVPAPRLHDVLQLAEPLSFEEAHGLGTLHGLADGLDALDEAGGRAAAALAALDAPAFVRTRSVLGEERCAAVA